MPEITRRRTGEMLRQLFEVLLPVPEGVQAREALAELEKRVTLTEYEQGEYASGGRRFEKIVRFATVDLVKAGWLHKEKGRWIVTDEGKKAYQTFSDPEAFYKEAVRLFHQWKASQPADVDVPESEEETPAKAATITLEKAEEQAWYEVDQYLRSMNPYEFQEIVASLLRAMGYHISWIAPPGKDGGIDILAASDRLARNLLESKSKSSDKRRLLRSTDFVHLWLSLEMAMSASLFRLGDLPKTLPERRAPKRNGRSRFSTTRICSIFGSSITISSMIKIGDDCLSSRFTSWLLRPEMKLSRQRIL